MTFLTSQVSVPLWVLLLLVAGLIPLLFQGLSWLKGKGILAKADREIVFGGEMKIITPSKPKGEPEKKNKRLNEVKILKLLAATGEQGMLLQSIADNLEIDSNTTNHALKYLSGKKMVEVVSSMGGEKYFLSQAGKHYCSKKGYIQKAA